MDYEQDQYWKGLSKTKPSGTVKTAALPSNLTVVPRSIPWQAEVTAKAEKEHRAAKPSPLLEEWLRVRGMSVK